MAPEVLSWYDEDAEGEPYDQASDLWSLGACPHPFPPPSSLACRRARLCCRRTRAAALPQRRHSGGTAAAQPGEREVGAARPARLARPEPWPRPTSRTLPDTPAPRGWPPLPPLAGVLLYVMLAGCAPFCAAEEEELVALVASASYSMADAPWPTVSAEAKALVRALLVANPAERLSVRGLLDHPWLREAVGIASARVERERREAAEAEAARLAEIAAETAAEAAALAEAAWEEERSDEDADEEEESAEAGEHQRSAQRAALPSLPEEDAESAVTAAAAAAGAAEVAEAAARLRLGADSPSPPPRPAAHAADAPPAAEQAASAALPAELSAALAAICDKWHVAEGARADLAQLLLTATAPPGHRR